jgi:hypothetical protein
LRRYIEWEGLIMPQQGNLLENFRKKCSNACKVSEISYETSVN